MSERVTIFEVGPRDGLQNEKRHIPAADKIRLVDMLSEAGFSKIEVTSFVSPRWVPQMGDAAEVMSGIRRRAGTHYTALTPNLKGFEGALAARADEIAIFGAASESFSKANINCTIDESLERFAPVVAAATEHGIPVRGYVSCVAVCPYEGRIAPEAVARVAARMMAMGCYEISLGDTIGRATPEDIISMLKVVQLEVEPCNLAGHFHDTDGRAIDNIAASLEQGVRVFDAAVGGLGGCPYAPGASGNVATERVCAFLSAEGFETGIDASALAAAAAFARTLRAEPGTHDVHDDSKGS